MVLSQLDKLLQDAEYVWISARGASALQGTFGNIPRCVWGTLLSFSVGGPGTLLNIL